MIPGGTAAAELADAMEPLHVQELLNERKRELKSVMTRSHAAIAIGWGLAVAYLLQWLYLQLAMKLGGSSLQLLMGLDKLMALARIVLCGLPWLYFLSQEQAKYRNDPQNTTPHRPLDRWAMAAVVAIGGLLTYLIANFLLSILEWVGL